MVINLRLYADFLNSLIYLIVHSLVLIRFHTTIFFQNCVTSNHTASYFDMASLTVYSYSCSIIYREHCLCEQVSPVYRKLELDLKYDVDEINLYSYRNPSDLM